MPLPQVVHPIHDQTFFLNEEHKRKLKDEYRKQCRFYHIINSSLGCSSAHFLLRMWMLVWKDYCKLTFVNFAEVEPWTFEQHLGEAVFIPAGCPHQVRNLKVRFQTFNTPIHVCMTGFFPIFSIKSWNVLNQLSVVYSICKWTCFSSLSVLNEWL